MDNIAVTESEFIFRKMREGECEALIVRYGEVLAVPEWHEGMRVVSLERNLIASGEDRLCEVRLNGEILRIGFRAFGECKALERVFIPKSVTHIHSDAFVGCGAVYIEVDEENALYSSDAGSLYSKNKDSLIRACAKGCFFVRREVVEIGEHAFSGIGGIVSFEVAPENTRFCCDASGLYAVNHPRRGNRLVRAVDKERVAVKDGTAEISEGAFLGLCSLSQVHIPPSVTSLYSSALSGLCRISFTVDADNPSFASHRGSLYTKDMRRLLRMKDEEEVTLNKDLRDIDDFALSGCVTLRTLHIPDGLFRIGAYSFSECKSLEKLFIPSSVEEVGYGAFSGCERLEVLCEADLAGLLWNEDYNIDGVPVKFGAHSD